jgi:hypothetical protein
MGRSRRRQTAATRLGRPTASPQPLRPSRRLLAAYLGAALVLAIVVLAGTMALNGTAAPWIVLAIVTAGALATQGTIGMRLAEAELTDDDRLLQTLAGGLLVLVVVFAIIAAVVLTAA